MKTSLALPVAALLLVGCGKDTPKPEATPSATAVATVASSAPATVASAPAAPPSVASVAAAADAAAPATASEKPKADLKAVKDAVDEICACKDAACAEAVQTRLSNDYAEVKDEDEEAAKPIIAKGGACAAKLSGATAADGAAAVKALKDATAAACACADMKCLQIAAQKITEVSKHLGAAAATPADVESIQASMTQFSSCSMKLAMAAMPTGSAQQGITTPATFGYRQYKNAKHGFKVDVPSFFNAAGATADGSTWKWDTRGQMDAAGYEHKGSVKKFYDDGKKEAGTTYSTMKDDAYMITGKKNGMIFWVRGMGDADSVYVVRLAYDEALKSFFDPIVSHVSRSFGPIM